MLTMSRRRHPASSVPRFSPRPSSLSTDGGAAEIFPAEAGKRVFDTRIHRQHRRHLLRITERSDSSFSEYRRSKSAISFNDCADLLSHVSTVMTMPPLSSIFLPFSRTAMVATTSRVSKPLTTFVDRCFDVEVDLQLLAVVLRRLLGRRGLIGARLAGGALARPFRGFPHLLADLLERRHLVCLAAHVEVVDLFFLQVDYLAVFSPLVVILRSPDTATVATTPSLADLPPKKLKILPSAPANET